MRILIDFFPIALFVAFYKLQGIYTATAVLMAATVVQTAIIYAMDKRLQMMQKVTLALVLVFGVLTLVLQDERFIKWKPTVLYWCFAGALTVSTLFFGKNLIRSLLGAQMELPEPVWQTLNWSWVAFFVLMGVINLLVAFAMNLSTDTWVNFKMFGGIGLTLAFALAQGVYLTRHLKEKE